MSGSVVQQIRKATRRQFSAEEKIRIVLEGLRGEMAVSELGAFGRTCRPRFGRRSGLQRGPRVAGRRASSAGETWSGRA